MTLLFDGVIVTYYKEIELNKWAYQLEFLTKQ